jgi:hypothetical protein
MTIGTIKLSMHITSHNYNEGTPREHITTIEEKN